VYHALNPIAQIARLQALRSATNAPKASCSQELENVQLVIRVLTGYHASLVHIKMDQQQKHNALLATMDIDRNRADALGVEIIRIALNVIKASV
jgi:hypothetical protein